MFMQSGLNGCLRRSPSSESTEYGEAPVVLWSDNDVVSDQELEVIGRTRLCCVVRLHQTPYSRRARSTDPKYTRRQ